MINDVLAKLRAIDPASADAIEAIAAERLGQIEREGYSPAHDDEHGIDQLAHASAAYGLSACTKPVIPPATAWPWEQAGFKPVGDAKDLCRSGALTVAAFACQIRADVPNGWRTVEA